MSNVPEPFNPFEPSAVLGFSRGGDLTWDRMVSEWFDNAIQAGATTVYLRRRETPSGPVLQVGDNGRGCDDIISMVKLGCSGADATGMESVSMYGTGGAAAQLRASDCGLTTIKTVYANADGDKVSTRLRMPWEEYARGSRTPPNITSRAIAATAPTGTEITIHNPKRIKDRPKLVQSIGFAYASRIREGKLQVTVDLDGKAFVVPAFEPPPAKRGSLVRFVVHHEGHAFKVTAWIVKPGVANPCPGVFPRWGYRTMRAADAATGDYPTNRVHGYIDVPMAFKAGLNLTKDDFHDDPEAVYAAILDKLRPLLEEARDEGQTIELRDLGRGIEDALTDALCGGHRARRPGPSGPPKEPGEPTSNGRPHKDAAEKQPGGPMDGPGRRSSSDNGVHRIAVILDDTLDAAFHVDVKRQSVTVYLNPRSPLVAAAKESPDAINGLVLSWVLQKVCAENLHDCLPGFQSSSYATMVTEALSKIVRPVVPSAVA